MEYIVIGLLVVIVGLLWFKNPSKMKNTVTDSVLKRIKDNREEISEGVYQKLPSEAKKDLPESAVRAGVEQLIDTAIEVIEEGIKP
jgi:hypothetical protein